VELDFEDFVDFGSEFFIELVLEVEILVECFEEIDGFGMVKIVEVGYVFFHLVFSALK
jgi:hypothetical protein